MKVTNARVRVKHGLEITSELLDSKVGSIQSMFSERVFRETSCFLSNEEKKYSLFINKSTIEFEVDSWEDVFMFDTIIRNFELKDLESFRINITVKYLGYKDEFNNLLKSVPEGVVTEFLGFKYSLEDEVFYITIVKNTDELEIKLGTTTSLKVSQDTVSHLSNIYSTLENDIYGIVKEYIGG